MTLLKLIWNDFLNTNFFASLVSIFALIIALSIGQRQNEINFKIGQVQDSVELFAALDLRKIPSPDQTSQNKDLQLPIIKIQNVGTRIIYIDNYNFNGSVYDVNGQVLPPTYSQAGASYWIYLPLNFNDHVNVVVEFRDIENRKWRSKIIADIKNTNWDVKTFPREEIK